MIMIEVMLIHTRPNQLLRQVFEWVKITLYKSRILRIIIK